MKGRNVIQMNYDTVVDAITEYLAKRMVTPPPIVLGIGTAYATDFCEQPAVDAQGRVNVTGHLRVLIQEPVDFLTSDKKS